MSKLLWTLQIFWGLFFLLASGAPKLFLPIDSLPMPIPISEPVLKTIGILEVLGGLGIILPGVTRMYTWLTPLAALGLTLTALGGATYQMMANEPGNAVFALVVALLCAFIAYGRWKLLPHRDRSRVNAASERAI
jgi:hypothetical protein